MVRAMPQEITGAPQNVLKSSSYQILSHKRVYTFDRRSNHRRELVVTRKPPGYICIVFGIGGEELVIIGLLILVIFGPRKPPQMARDLGRFINEARNSVEEFKDELIADDDEDEDRRPKRKR